MANQMNDFHVLHKSTPASPLKGMKMTPTWRLSKSNMTADEASKYVRNQLFPNNYKVVHKSNLNYYL